DAVEDPVDEPSGLAGRILLREGDGLVDHGAGRDVARVELVDRDAQDVPLDRAEPVGRPAGLGGRLGDAPVELGRVADDRVGDRARVLVDLALVQLAGRALGHVPLVEERERGLAGLPAADRHHTRSSIATSTAETVTSHMVPSAPATRSCTARAASGSTTPRSTASSRATRAEPSAMSTST